MSSILGKGLRYLCGPLHAVLIKTLCVNTSPCKSILCKGLWYSGLWWRGSLLMEAESAEAAITPVQGILEAVRQSLVPIPQPSR